MKCAPCEANVYLRRLSRRESAESDKRSLRWRIPDPGEESRALFSAYDRLPAPIRQALRESPFDLHIGMRLNRDMDCSALVARIRAVASLAEAEEFNRQHR